MSEFRTASVVVRRRWLLQAPFAMQLRAAETRSVRRLWDAAGANVLGAPTADGRLLTCIDPQTRDLAVLQTATGKLLRLTSKGPARAKEFAWFSVPAPDASRVAVAWFNEAGFYDLRVVGTQSRETSVVFRNEEVRFVQPTSWTPDGSHILTLFFRKDNTSQIALVNSQSGAVRILRSLNWVYPKRMQFSPDGRWIAYDAFPGAKAAPRDIFLLAADGSREARLITDASDDLFPVWSPDGTELLFASDRGGSMGAWVVRVKDGRTTAQPRCLKPDLGAFVPMGATTAGALFYGLRVRSEEIAIMDEAGTLPTVLATRTPGKNSAPSWSNDGSRLAYLSVRGPENFSVPGRVVVIREMESGSERDIPAKLATINWLRWCPDGETLLASGSDGKGRSGLFRIRLQDGGVSPAPETDTQLASDPAITASTEGQDERPAAFARQSKVIAGDREWSVDGVTWLEWAGENLIACSKGQPLLLDKNGVHALNWKGYDGGPFSVHPQGGKIALGIGGTRSEVWVMDHAFAPLPDGG